MKFINQRWAVLINCIWIIIWSTYIYKADGNYPLAYLVWFVIIAIIGIIITWCFSTDFHTCDDCHKVIQLSEGMITRTEKSCGETQTKYYHEACLHPYKK